MSEQHPELSIIIVSYNSWEFLDLTLHSVEKALEGIPSEVIVVDNASSVDVVAKISQCYPSVIAVANQQNLGFSKANNIGLKIARGRFAVLVNPDIIVAEDTFERVLNYFNEYPDVTGLGVRMLNGEGQYLRESKRGLPTPAVSFYKMLGLTTLFPRSGKLARYYHGNLDERENHKIDILAGAFLAQRRDKEGCFEWLDEQYFMYGEDIDLSYCLSCKFGANHYLGTNPIIHFKGKSTITNAWIYKCFYQSMWIFYKKYFKKKTFFLVNGFIWLAINGIQTLKIAGLAFKKSNTPLSQSKHRKVLLISSDSNIKASIQKLYQAAEIKMAKEVITVDQFDLIVFDLATTKAKYVINVLEKFGTSPYAYLAFNRKYLVENSLAGRKGQVLYL